MIDQFWLSLGSVYIWFHTPWTNREWQEFRETLFIVGSVVTAFISVYIMHLSSRHERQQKREFEEKMKQLKEREWLS